MNVFTDLSSKRTKLYVTRKVKLYLPEHKQLRLAQWEGLMRSLYNHLLDYWNTYMKNGYYRALNCKKCGFKCDRDENAARNVYAYAGMGYLKASNGLDDMETSGNLTEKCRYHNVSAGALAG